MNSHDRDVTSRDPRLPLTAVIKHFERIADEAVPLSPACVAALPESPVTWRRLGELLADTSVPFEVMDVDLVWRWLLERARRDGEEAVLVCAGLAVPMLAATAARLAHRVGSDRADAEAAVLAAFVHAVGHLNLRKTRVWCALRWAAFRGGRRWEKQEALSGIPIPPEDFGLRAQRSGGDVEALLTLAVAEGVIDAEDAELIADTRLTRRTLIALATERGEPYKRLHKRRKLAETRLQRWLHARIADSDSDRTSIVEASALDAVTRSQPGRPLISPVAAISERSRASTGCAEPSAASAHPTPAEVKRCA
ncbi:hypothetical protein [Nocardia vulneris]|uniref:hypothetical protein n=1 Tax=Nocardia vulneris TaxID=1141657 RepID=UPI0012DFF716|nr:hypothetical protein [Nocardia vulneris]